MGTNRVMDDTSTINLIFMMRVLKTTSWLDLIILIEVKVYLNNIMTC